MNEIQDSKDGNNIMYTSPSSFILIIKCTYLLVSESDQVITALYVLNSTALEFI